MESKKQLELTPSKTAKKVAEKRELDIAKMEGQLKTWSTQINKLVAGYLEAGAQANDPYRVRVDALREKVGTMENTLLEFNNAPMQEREAWAPFQATVNDDWNALELGFKDLTH